MTQNHVCDGHCGETCGCTHYDGDRCESFTPPAAALAAAEARLKEAEGYLRSWFEQGEVCPVCSQDPHGYGCSLAAFLRSSPGGYLRLVEP